MMVRCEIACPVAGSDGASPDSTARIRWAGLPTEGRCSSVSASAADMFMNDAG